MAYIAQYSPRPGAASSRWQDDIPREVKKERYARSTQVLQKHTLPYNKKMIGNTYRVIVTGKDRKEGYLSALTEGKIVLRFKSNDESLIGNFADVKMLSATPFSLEAELIQVKELKTV
jgi:tRNA-2-methylthio-N6-dimethylallyladenosine synthase